jgi:hypothetical protein
LHHAMSLRIGLTATPSIGARGGYEEEHPPLD